MLEELSTMPGIAIVTALTCFVVGYQLVSVSVRNRFWRRVRCLVSDHSPGPLVDTKDNRRIQRCDYCDRVVREYRVERSQHLGAAERITRI